MISISKEEAFGRGLPKWPQMLVTGDTVTVEQAKDIIFRTDSFMTQFRFSWGGGNDRHFNRSFWESAGYMAMFIRNMYVFKSAPNEDFPVDENEMLEYRALQEAMNSVNEEFEKEMGFISNTEYVRNNMVASCYIYGAHGWCNPDGTISYVDNVGKWPSVEEIFNEWSTIAAAFPYLNVYVTLMSGEQCEDNKRPVVTLHVKDGSVSCFEPDMSKHDGMKNPDRSMDAMVASITGNFFNSKSTAIPREWIGEFCEKTYSLIPKLFEKHNISRFDDFVRRRLVPIFEKDRTFSDY